MMSRFSREEAEQTTLADTGYVFPKDVYPVGRLDKDSEGLLILTNDRQLNDMLLNPQRGHRRSYTVQVEGVVTPEAVAMLERGMTININGSNHKTKKAECRILPDDPGFPERVPPVRFRKSVPTSWIRLTLTEGKNRQVRKMTAAAGFPTLRLIRTAIEKLALDDMKPGEVRQISRNRLYALLGIKERQENDHM